MSKKWECERQWDPLPCLFVCQCVMCVRAIYEKCVRMCVSVCQGGWPLQIYLISGTIKSTFMSRPKKGEKKTKMSILVPHLFFRWQQKSKISNRRSLVLTSWTIFFFFSSKTNFISCAMCSGKRHRLQFTQSLLCSLNYSDFFIFMVVRTSYAADGSRKIFTNSKKD